MSERASAIEEGHPLGSGPEGAEGLSLPPASAPAEQAPPAEGDPPDGPARDPYPDPSTIRLEEHAALVTWAVKLATVQQARLSDSGLDWRDLGLDWNELLQVGWEAMGEAKRTYNNT